MTARPDWAIEGRDWPNRQASRFVHASGLEWHVQVMGSGPILLLIHGTGAATHSWRTLAPMLAKRFLVVSLDLPGHGFTELPIGGQFTLPQMAGAISQLLSKLDLAPTVVVGHSAGAAIAIRMALDRALEPSAIYSLNGALMPFAGLASVAFPAIAKLLFLNRFAAPLLVRRVNEPGTIAKLLRNTGSQIDSVGIELYERLLRTERHMAATVGMMANWDLHSLKRSLCKLRSHLVLVVADGDRTISPQVANDTKMLVPRSDIVHVKTYGHLAHEEAPLVFDEIIRGAAFERC